MAKNRDFPKGISNVPYDQAAPLAERLNYLHKANSPMTHGGRGHGRMSERGRGKKPANQPTRREMLYFVRDIVRNLREAPDRQIPQNTLKATTHDFANVLARDVQFFDCSELTGYIESNWHEMYPDRQVPVSPKVILPAPAVGLYVNNLPDIDPYTEEPDGTFGEVMFVCTPRANSGSTTNFSIVIVSRNLDHSTTDAFLSILGTIDSEKGVFGISPKNTNPEGLIENLSSKESRSLRIVAAYLQTINNPRFVRRGKKTFSQMKKHSAKKVLRDFIAEQWNMVSWNVDKSVDAKNYEEGNGGRQGLHFRRGFFRRGESHWQNVQMIDGVCRQWIEGYEAGHPAFGVKKSYHLPRKDT